MDLSLLRGALRYEFRMQVQRWPVWVVMLALSLTAILGIFYTPVRGWDQVLSFNEKTAIVFWTVLSNWSLSLGFGILLADRLPRDKRTNMNELFGALAGSSSARLLGKYLGSMLGTAMPIFFCYGSGLLYIVVRLQTVSDLWVAVPAFAAITLPSLIFVGAFSLACPAVIWVPLSQFLFIGYYFWGNAFDAVGFGIPTLSGTVLTPGGGLRAVGFFGVHYGVFIRGTLLDAVVSTILMFACAAIALFALWCYLAWQRARA
jgi:hypothetical protein